MPTFDVQIAERSLRIPAPHARVARSRGLRRAIAFMKPGLCRTLRRAEVDELIAQMDSQATVNEDHGRRMERASYG